MKNRFIRFARAGYRGRTAALLAAAVLAVAAAAGYPRDGGRWFLPAEPLPAGFSADGGGAFFTPLRQPGGETWMVSAYTDDRFLRAKPAGTVRVFIVGGSVARFWIGSGDPLVRTLEAAWPSLRFEVVNCGVDGYDSSRERRVLNEVLGCQPDLIVLLSGNNQFREPLSRWRQALFLANRQLRRAAVFRSLQDRLRSPPVAGPSARARLRNFERDVRGMLRACRSRGVAFLPVVLPANLRDYAPQAPPDVLRGDSALGRAGLALIRRRFGEVVCLLSPAVERADAPALAWFWLGRALDGLGRDGEARAAYIQALERDEAANRACPSLNAVLRSLAAETNTGLVDLDAAFVALDSRHMPGSRQFRDNCHWNAGYYRVLSLLVAGELWKNRSRYGFLPGGSDGFLPRSPLEMPPPGKTPEDLEKTVTPLLLSFLEKPGDLKREKAVYVLEGLAREGLFGAPCRLSFRFFGGRMEDWMDRDEAFRAEGLDQCWPAFMLLESQACLRAGRLQDARGWLARAVKLKPALKQDPAALYLRWLLARGADDEALWRARFVSAGGGDGAGAA